MTHIDDLLSSTLQSLRIHGAVLLRETYAPPWAISIPGTGALKTLPEPERRNARRRLSLCGSGVLYRQMEETPNPESETSVTEMSLDAGEMAICFSGTGHRLVAGTNPQTMLLERSSRAEPTFSSFERTVAGNGTSLICGVFLLHDIRLNPLFAALPPLLHTSSPRPVNGTTSSALSN